MNSNIINQSNLISRDLSWLNFNYRVLDQVKDKNRGVLDKLKFLSIVSSNFDEFFEIRGYRMETFRSKYFITKIRRSTYTSI